MTERPRATAKPREVDPLTTALVAIFEALAERDGVPVAEIVEAFVAGYFQEAADD